MDERMPQGFNVKCTYITEDIRVSTGVYIGNSMFGGYYGQVETFIFHPKGQRSPMKIHGTFRLNYDDDAKKEFEKYETRLKAIAIRAHDRYVRFYMRRYKTTALRLPNIKGESNADSTGNS